jgi:hypothetical protein
VHENNKVRCCKLGEWVQISAKDRKPSYFDLYGQSELVGTKIELAYLDQLAKRFFSASLIEGTKVVEAKPNQQLQKLFDIIVDICEKLGFLWLAGQEVERIQSKHEIIDGDKWYYVECGQIKYHLYSCIFNAKATSDSVSVLLNELHRLGYERGQIDLIKERKFRRDLKQKCHQFDTYWKGYGSWFTNLGEFRDATIHRQFIPVFVPFPKDRMVADFRPVLATNIDGKATIFFTLHGITGHFASFSKGIFKFKGLQIVTSQQCGYVMPNSIARYDDGMRKGDLKFGDFQDVFGYCRLAFIHLKSLAEIAFKETFEQIATLNS